MQVSLKRHHEIGGKILEVIRCKGELPGPGHDILLSVVADESGLQPINLAGAKADHVRVGHLRLEWARHQHAVPRWDDGG